MAQLYVYNSNGYAVLTTIDERVPSRKLTSGDKSKDDLDFVIQGSCDYIQGVDEIAVFNAINSVCPASYAGMDFDHVDQVQEQGGGIWYGTAKYVNPNNTQKTGQMLVSFDTAGKQEKIYVSLSTSGVYPATPTPPDNKQTIGNTNDRVEGVEVTTPQYKLTLTYYVPNSSVTTAYIGLLYSLTGTVNNGTFFGMNEGECLFLGAKGSRRGRGDWELTFEFAGSPNATGLVVGGVTVATKKGWEYLWVRFQKNVSNGALMEQASWVYVEKVYNETDLSQLGIGTTFPMFPSVGVYPGFPVIAPGTIGMGLGQGFPQLAPGP